MYLNLNKVTMRIDILGKGRKTKGKRRCRGSNPGHPRDRREYLPLYYNDFVGKGVI